MRAIAVTTKRKSRPKTFSSRLPSVGHYSVLCRKGSNEELSKGIVPWNFISCLALASMKKSKTLDLMLGSVVLGALLAVIVVSGIIWNIV